MKKEEVKEFVNKKVKLVQKDNWVLYGTIISIFEDSLVFRTKDKKSLISFDFISSIVIQE